MFQRRIAKRHHCTNSQVEIKDSTSSLTMNKTKKHKTSNKECSQNTNTHTSITRAQNSMQTKSMHKMVIHKLNDKTSCHVSWGGFGCILSHNKQTDQQNHQTKAKPQTNPSKK